MFKTNKIYRKTLSAANHRVTELLYNNKVILIHFLIKFVFSQYVTKKLQKYQCKILNLNGTSLDSRRRL